MSAQAWETEESIADERRERPVRPGDDPFYESVTGLRAMSPGTILRARRVELGLFGLIPQRGLQAWQLAYRSNNLWNEPEVAVTTVIVPRDHDTDKPQRLVAYQCAIDAVSDRCFPSYALRPGAKALGCATQAELFLMAELLGRGYVLSVADHEGLAGTFAAPREPGYRVLDGVRAALAFEELALNRQTLVGMVGYSGGGMASAWAAEMAPTYAPELNVVGAALGSPVGDPGEAFIKLNDGFWAGLPALVVSGLQHVYPGLEKIVREHTNAEGRYRLDALQEMSTVGAITRYAFDDFDDYVDAPLADVLAQPEVIEVFDDIRLGKHAPTCPLLVMQSVHDQIIHIKDVDAQVERYVDGGTEVRYVRDKLSDHIVLLVLGLPSMLDWLDDRFAGKPVPTGTRQSLSVAISPKAWLGYLRMAGSTVKTALGRAG